VDLRTFRESALVMRRSSVRRPIADSGSIKASESFLPRIRSAERGASGGRLPSALAKHPQDGEVRHQLADILTSAA